MRWLCGYLVEVEKKFVYVQSIPIEMKALGTANRSQIVTGSQKHRDLKSLPYAFTEFASTMDVEQWRPSTSLGIAQDMFWHDGLGRVWYH